MKRPAELLFAVDETPPPRVLFLSALQHVGVVAPTLVAPLIVARAAGLDSAQLVDFVSLGMLGLAMGTLLLSLHTRYLGTGYLCPATYTNIYFGPSMTAVQHGGLPMVFGMTFVAGVMQLGIAPLMRRLRALMPTEIAGLVIAIVGLNLAANGIKYGLGIDAGGNIEARSVVIAAVTLVTMVVLNVWCKGYFKVFCALIGIVVGIALSVALGTMDAAGLSWDSVATLRVASFTHVSWDFDPMLAIPFFIACMGATLKLVGDVTNAQRINDADWIRPDFMSLRGGVAGAGLATLLSGIIGAPGQSNNSASIGLSAATGITSRSVGYSVAALWFALSLAPSAAIALISIPAPVAGAALFFSSAFVLTNGLQMITARLLDARKSIVIGFSFAMAMMADAQREAFSGVPDMLQPLFGSALVLGTVCAVTINLVMRIGIRKRVVLRVPAERPPLELVEQFLTTNGAKWAARRDVVSRAIFGAAQTIEVIRDDAKDMRIEASFDEFSLDLRLRYKGAPLPLPETRPDAAEVIATAEGERMLAGFMVRRNADRVSTRIIGDEVELLLHFEH